MKLIVGAVVLVITVTGCVSQQELDQRQAGLNNLQSRLSSAQAYRTATCPNAAACEKAFRLAKIYVQDNADMKVQFSDDTTISTYNPIKYAYVGLRATRIPGSGDSSTIELVAFCKGMEDRGYFFSLCAQRIAPIYEGFKSYIETRL